MSALGDCDAAAMESMSRRRAIREGLRLMRPAEKAWIVSLKKLLATMPEGLTVIADEQADGCTVYLDGANDGHDVAHLSGRIGSSR